MTVAYYDRKGWPISLMEWAHLMEDDEYRRIGLDFVGEWKVSTVWLGLDHSFLGDGAPLIFETMVFNSDDEYQRRYSTEEQARCGHFQTVAKVRQVLADGQ